MPFDRAYAEGKAQLASGHPGLAIVAFERAARLDATSVPALNGIGAAYDELKRYDIAMGYYRRALALAPRDAATMNNIAVSLRLSGNSAAADWLDKAAHIAPSDAVIAANIAQARADGVVAAARHEPAADTVVETAPASSKDESPKIDHPGVATPQPVPPPAVNPPARAAPAAASLAIPVAARIEAPPAPRHADEGGPAGDVTQSVAVSNCVGRTGMAKRFRAFFRSEGLPVRHITNSPPFDCLKTRLLARPGHNPQAQLMARLVPQPIQIETDGTITDDIRLVLGRDLVDFDQTLGD